MAKLKNSDLMKILLQDGTVKSIKGFSNPTITVEHLGHTYVIENSQSPRPKIKQIS